jgi:hypothetical protein
MGPGRQPWQVLSALPAWEVTEVPRRDRPDRAPGEGLGPDYGDHGVVQRALALAAAHRGGAPVVFGWTRDRAAGPVRVIAAGPGVAAAADANGEAVLTLPAGARARPVPPGGATAAFCALACWTPVAVIADALLCDQGQDPGFGRAAAMAAPSLEEALLGSWPGPFGWLVIAWPVPGDVLGEMTSEVALAQLAAMRLDSPRAQLAARRAAGRHAELQRARASGLWEIRLLAGSESPQAAAQVSALLCASADLGGLPYALVPAKGGGPLPHLLGAAAQPGRAARAARDSSGLMDVLDWQPSEAAAQPAWPGMQADTARAAAQPARLAMAAAPARATAGSGAALNDDDPVPQFPCAGSSRLLAALARPPAREVPGVRLAVRPDFDVTPETTATAAAGGVTLGTVLDHHRVPAGELAVPLASLNRHVFVSPGVSRPDA